MKNIGPIFAILLGLLAFGLFATLAGLAALVAAKFIQRDLERGRLNSSISNQVILAAVLTAFIYVGSIPGAVVAHTFTSYGSNHAVCRIAKENGRTFNECNKLTPKPPITWQYYFKPLFLDYALKFFLSWLVAISLFSLLGRMSAKNRGEGHSAIRIKAATTFFLLAGFFFVRNGLYLNLSEGLYPECNYDDYLCQQALELPMPFDYLGASAVNVVEPWYNFQTTLIRSVGNQFTLAVLFPLIFIAWSLFELGRMAVNSPHHPNSR